MKDVEDAKSGNDSHGGISIGLPAYSLLLMLIKSAKSNSAGLLLSKSCCCFCSYLRLVNLESCDFVTFFISLVVQVIM